MFEKAVRMKLRFHYRGVLSVEDLWDLDVEELDLIYKNLKRQQKESSEESLLSEKTKEESLNDLRLKIVTYIVKTKIQESNGAKEKASLKLKKDKLLSIINEKENEKLKDMSIEDLKKQVEAIG